MKFLKINYLLIAVLLLGVVSCSMNKDPLKVYTESREKQKGYDEVSFNVISVMEFSGKTEVKNQKVYVKRDKNELGVKFRIEDDKGVITTFDGKRYVWTDDKEKKAFVVDSLDAAKKYAKNMMDLVVRVINPEKDKKVEKPKDNKRVYRGSGWIDGYLCDILHLEDRDSSLNIDFISESNYDRENGFLRKTEDWVYANGIKIQFERTLVRDINVKRKICECKFHQRIPNSYQIDYYKPPEPEAEDVAEEAVNIGVQAPDWTLTDGKGREISLSSLKGKVVMLDFWGTWCVWCVIAMPKVEAVYKEFKGNSDVVVYGISCKEREKADPVKFAKQKGCTYDILLNGQAVAESYGVRGYPTIVIIDKEGKISQKWSGYNPDMDKELIDMIKKLLGAKES